jgi:hypothetical protein
VWPILVWGSRGTPDGVVAWLATAVPLPSVLWRVHDLDSHEWISNVEELEFSEICVGGVEGSDLVLPK